MCVTMTTPALESGASVWMNKRNDDNRQENGRANGRKIMRRPGVFLVLQLEYFRGSIIRRIDAQASRIHPRAWIA